MLVDSHCHLDFPDFADDLPEIIAQAERCGVKRMVTINTRPSGLAGVKSIAETYDSVYFASGVHPLNVGEQPLPTVDELVAVAEHPKMVGMGETGLDYHYDKWPHDMQQQSFRTHIDAARETGLPLIIHARDADADIETMLREGYANGPYTCVMHCFSSGRALAEAALELGFYLSMSGVATFKNAQSLRDIFAAAPVERILVETDAPYLAPVPKRGKRNEPAYVVHTASVGAEVFGLTSEDFARQTTENFHRLFTRMPRLESAMT